MKRKKYIQEVKEFRKDANAFIRHLEKDELLTDMDQRQRRSIEWGFAITLYSTDKTQCNVPNDIVSDNFVKTYYKIYGNNSKDLLAKFFEDPLQNSLFRDFVRNNNAFIEELAGKQARWTKEDIIEMISQYVQF